MFTTNILRIFGAVFFAGACMAQVPFFGRCPNYSVKANFDLIKYLGRWYEQERYFAVFEFGGKCTTADYSLNFNETVHVLNTQISAITGMVAKIEGIAAHGDPTADAKLIVTFPSLPITFGAPYWILDTDYMKYSIVWSCSEFGLLSTKNAWILTRDRFPTLEVIETAYKIIHDFGLNKDYFIKTDQDNCPLQY